MNELNCKKCDKPTSGHDDDVVAVTCSMCSMLGVIDLLEGMDTHIVGGSKMIEIISYVGLTILFLVVLAIITIYVGDNLK